MPNPFLYMDCFYGQEKWKKQELKPQVVKSVEHNWQQAYQTSQALNNEAEERPCKTDSQLKAGSEKRAIAGPHLQDFH